MNDLLNSLKELKKALEANVGQGGPLFVEDLVHPILFEDLHIKIRKIDSPIISGGGHDFHLFLSSYAIRPYFLLNQEQWREVHEFESYRMKSFFIKPYENLEDLNKYLDSNPDVQEMRRLLRKSKSQIWQMNARAGNDYIRTFAIFGQNTMRPITWFEEKISYPLASLWTKVLNLYVGLYNKLVMFQSLTPDQAQKVVERGGTVTTLDIGARKYLYKLIDGKLHCHVPFYKENEWKLENRDKVPEFFKYYREVK